MDTLRKYVRSILREMYQSHTDEPIEGDAVINTNQNCKHVGSEGTVLSVDELPDNQGKVIAYECTNDGPTWDVGDVLSKTMDQLEPLDTAAGRMYKVRRV
jgi:hypothetical protein